MKVTRTFSTIISCMLLSLFSLTAANAAHPVDFGKELLISDLSVVNDPLRTTYVPFDPSNPDAGAWSFGRLMENLSPNQNVSEFVLNWLSTWANDVTVNGDLVEARTTIINRVIRPWVQNSPATGLDMNVAPFRLLAIVNRMDLRSIPDSSALRAGNAGEGRFIFGVLDEAGNPQQFTIILEYELLADTVEEVQQWAAQWHALGELEFGEAYNLALRDITDRFTLANIAPSKANGSALNQLRSNEIALAAPWELREFNLSSETGNLFLTTVKLTPKLETNGSARLAGFINQNEAAILEETHVIPNIALGAHSRSSTNPGSNLTWDAPGINNPVARHKFALNTCSGCHTVETSTGFLHVSNRPVSQAATLSPFLSGAISVNDPAGSGEIFNFDEPQRRIDDLNSLLTDNVNQLLQAVPLQRVH